MNAATQTDLEVTDITEGDDELLQGSFHAHTHLLELLSGYIPNYCARRADLAASLRCITEENVRVTRECEKIADELMESRHHSRELQQLREADLERINQLQDSVEELSDQLVEAGRVEDHLRDRLIDASAENLRWRNEYNGWSTLGGSDNED